MSDFRIKVSVDLETEDIDKQLKQLDKEHKITASVDMSNINKQIQTLKKSFQDAFNISSKDTKGLNNLIKTLTKLNNETNSKNTKTTTGITNLVKQYKELANSVSKLQKQLDKGGLGEKAVDRTKTQMTNMLTQMQKIKSQMNEMEKMDIDIFNQKMDNKALIDMNNYISKIETSTASLQTKINSISFDHIDVDVINRITDRLEEIKNTADNIDINFDMDGINKLLSDLSEIKTEITNLEKVENLASSFDKIKNSANDVGVEIKDLDQVIDNLASNANNLDGSFDKAFSNAKNEASELKNEIKEAESAMDSLSKTAKSVEGSMEKAGGAWKDFTGNFSQFTFAEVAGDFISDGIRTAVGGIKDTVVDTDSAIRDLKKVYGSLEGDELKDYLQNVTEVAKGTGQTSIDIINATAKAVQSGIKDLDQALQYAEKAAMFANVGDVDQGMADEMIASIMSAYAGGVENSLNYVQDEVYSTADAYDYLTKFIDLANYAGNNFAISTADVGQALQVAGAALTANGVSMEESVAMVVGMNEVLQDAGKTGNALKSISVSMAGITTSAKDGTLQSNKAAKALKELAGIDVWNKQTGEIKDTYQIMDELYKVWDDLSEAERAGLATSIAGKQNMNAFQALMSNWENVIELKEAYYSGETRGSAEAENAEYLDSIIAKWNAIKENLKSVVNSLISSDAVKGFLDIIEQITAKIAEFATTDFGKNALGLGGIATGIGLLSGAISKIPSISGIVKSLSSLGKISGLAKTATSLGKIGTAATTLGKSSGILQTVSTTLAGIGGTAAGITAAAAAVVALATAIGDCTNLMSTLQDGEGIFGFLGSMVAAGSEQMNGIVQTTLGTGWEFGKLVMKEIGALLTGNFSEMDDIWREGTANINTNLNEGISDFTNTTTTSLKLMKESTQEELSDVYDIYNTEFKRLPNLTANNMDEMADIYTDKLYGMTDESILIAQGMGGEIGATLFRGIEEGMSKEEIREVIKRNLQTLLSSGIITQDMVNGLVDDFNTQFDKAIDSNANYKQMTTDMFNQITDGIETGDIKDGFKDAAEIAKDWSNEMIATYAQQGEAHKSMMEGITADMTDKERWKKMYENANEYRKKEGQTWEEWNQQIREEQQGYHKEMVDDAEEAKEKTAEQYAGAFEDLDYEQRVKLATEFKNADESQLARIHEMLGRFEKPVQVKLKSEGYKEVLEESETMTEFLQNLPEDKLIKIMSDTQFVGELTPEELQVAVDRLPDETLSKLLVRTDFINKLTPEQLAIMLEGLPEEKRVEIISQYIHSGKRTPEQLGAALETLPPEKIVEVIMQYINEGGDPEKIEAILQTLPPEVRTVVRAALEDAGLIEKRKKEVEEIPEEKTTHLTTETDDDGLSSTKEGLDELPEEKTTTVKVKKEGEEPEQTKEELNTLDNKEVNPEINPLSDNSGMYMTDEQLNIMDNKEANPKVKTKSDDKEIDETNKKLEETDGKTATANVEVKVNAPTTSSGDEGMYTDKNALLEVVGLSENQTVEQTVEVKAEVTGVDTSGVAQIKIDPIKMTAIVEEVDTTTITSIKVEPIKIMADSSNAMLKISNVTTGLTGLKDKTVKILADSSNAMMKIQNVKNGLAGIKDKTVKILGDSSNAMLKIQRVKDALATLSGKTISLNVNKTVTESTVKKSLPTNPSTPMLTNSSLASVPVSASASPLSDTPVTISDNSLSSIPVSTRASSYGTLDASKILPSLDLGISHIKNLEEALERLGSQLDFIKEKSEATFGQEKINLLRQQIPLLKEQQKIQEQIANSERKQNNELINWLSNNGFKFDAIGNITNYNDKLLQMEQNVESLKKKHDDLNNASGDNKNEKAIKSANDAYENANETLSKTKKYLEEYFSTNNKEITEASKKWWEYENSIRDAEKAIRDLLNAQIQNKIDMISEEIDFLDSKIENLNDNQKNQYLEQQNKLYKEQQGLMHELAEQMRKQLTTLDKNSDEYIELQKEIVNLSTEWWELESAIKSTNEELEEIRRNKAIEPLQNSLEEINYLLDRQSDRLDLLDAQYEKATGEKRVEGLIKKEQILNEQLAAQEEAYKRIYNLAAGLQKDLWQFGFKLDANSLIANYDEVLNALVGTSEYERAKKYADEYMDVVRGDLIDIQKEAYETQNAIADLAEEMQEALDEAREERLEPFKNTLESVRYELDRVADRLDLLDSANERSQGKTKVDYLHDKIGLLNEEIATSQKEFSALYNLIAEAQNDLWQYGFRLDENSLIDNYDGVLNGLVGTEKYESAKKAADEYMSLMRDDYIENKLSISDLQNEIKELQDEIEKAERKLALFSSTNRLTELNEEFEELSNKIDVIGTKLEHAYGTDKITLMRKEIELLNDQLELQDKKMNTMLEQAQTYTDSLSKYGFTFDGNGSISNYAEILDIFRDDEQIENIKELCEEYMDLQDEISGLSSEYADLESAVKDAYKEMLDTTEDIEKEITEVIEKEYEKRKKEIEDFTDERITLLEKEKKEMQELWDQQDYEKSVKEQSDEIMELQKRISILSKDTSIAGQQKLKELTEELEEAQKKLEDITEDKIKDDYTNNIDGEIEKLEDEEKTLLEALDEKFSDIAIGKMVQDALQTGAIEIDGNIKSVQDALIESINQSADGYSVMANKIA